MSVRRPALTPDHPAPVAATIMTNAVPITAGLVPCGERLPHGIRAVLQLAAFACLVASAVALGRQQTPGSEPH